MNSVNDSSYITFYGWMRNRLNLKGTQLIVYAVVYSFSHDGLNTYNLNLGWIAEFIGVDVKTVSRAITDLEDKNYIYKVKNNSFSSPKYKYAVNMDYVYTESDKERTKCPLGQHAQSFTEEISSQNQSVSGDFSQNNADFESSANYDKNNCFTSRTKCPIEQTVQENSDKNSGNENNDLSQVAQDKMSYRTNCPTGQNVLYEADKMSGSSDKVLYKNNIYNISLSYKGKPLIFSDDEADMFSRGLMLLSMFLKIHDNLSCETLSNYSGGKLGGIDWFKIHEQIELSPQFLRNVPFSFLVDNYKKILEGRYVDYKRFRQKQSDSVLDKGGGSSTDFDSTSFSNIKYD